MNGAPHELDVHPADVHFFQRRRFNTTTDILRFEHKENGENLPSVKQNDVLSTQNMVKTIYIVLWLSDDQELKHVSLTIDRTETVGAIGKKLHFEQLHFWYKRRLRDDEQLFFLNLHREHEPITLFAYPAQSTFQIEVSRQNQSISLICSQSGRVEDLIEYVSRAYSIPLDCILLHQNGIPILPMQTLSHAGLLPRGGPVHVSSPEDRQSITFISVNSNAQQSHTQTFLVVQIGENLYKAAEDLYHIPRGELLLFSSRQRIARMSTLVSNGLVRVNRPSEVFVIDRRNLISIPLQFYSYTKRIVEAYAEETFVELGHRILLRYAEEFSSVQEMVFILGKSILDRNMPICQANFLHQKDTPLIVLSREKLVTFKLKLPDTKEEHSFQASPFDSWNTIRTRIESLVGIPVQNQIINSSRTETPWLVFQSYTTHMQQIILRVEDSSRIDQYPCLIPYPTQRMYARYGTTIKEGKIIAFCDHPSCEGSSSLKKKPNSFDELLTGYQGSCYSCSRVGIIHYRIQGPNGELSYPMQLVPNCVRVDDKLMIKFDCSHIVDPVDWERFYRTSGPNAFARNPNPQEVVTYGKSVLQCPICVANHQEQVGVAAFISVYQCSSEVKESAKSCIACLVDSQMKCVQRSAHMGLTTAQPNASGSIVKFLTNGQVSLATKQDLVSYARRRKERMIIPSYDEVESIISSIQQRDEPHLTPELIHSIRNYLLHGTK